MEVAKLIMRLATPPCVRNVPAKMKNGIAMISKLSSPVKSLSATDSVRTSVSVNMKVSTVRPSEIDTGMPVSISASSRTNMMTARMPCGSTMKPVACATQTATIKSGASMRMSPIGLLSLWPLLARRNFGGMKGIGFDAVDMADVVMRQLARSSKTTTPLAGTGNTSARSRAEASCI